MAIDVLFISEVRAHVMAGAVLAIASSGGNVEYIRGILALAQHQVIGLGFSWVEFAKEAQRELGVDCLALLDGQPLAILGDRP